MINGICLEGATREETYARSLAWMAGWAKDMADVLLGTATCLAISGGGRPFVENNGNCSQDELIAIIESQKIVMQGVVDAIRRKYRDENGQTILPSLKKSFADMKDMVEGKMPTMTTPWGIHVVDEKTLPNPEWPIVEIRQGWKFFRHREWKECVDFLVKSIEESSGGKYKDAPEVGLRVVFEDKKVVETLAGITRQERLPGDEQTPSVLEELVARYDTPERGLVIAWRSNQAEYIYASDSAAIDALLSREKKLSQRSPAVTQETAQN